MIYSEEAYRKLKSLIYKGKLRPGQRLVERELASRLEISPLKFPAVNANPLFGYIRPAAGGRLLLGIETAERDEHRVESPDFHFSALTVASDLKARIKGSFVSLLPAFESTTWELEKIGLLTFTMDGEPILGPVFGLSGLFLGVGFHSGGFAYNPASGQLLAEFVSEGQTSIDVSAFSPDRFSPDETTEYLKLTLSQKNVV